MAHNPGAIEASLAAALGDEPGLIAELRGAFFAGADAHVEALRIATSLIEWRAAAARLKSLAASFGALRLMAAADAVLVQNRIDRHGLHKIERAIAALQD